MMYNGFKVLLALFTAITCVATSALGADAPSAAPLPAVILDSRFDGVQIQGKSVAGWTIINGSPTVLQEGNRSFLHLQASETARTVQVRRWLPLNTDWGKLTVAASVRHKNVKRGEQNWQDARVIVEFFDEKNQKIGASPKSMSWKGTSKAGWITESLDYIIPFGAAKLKIDPALLSVTSGTLDLESLTVTVTENRADSAKGDILPESWRPALVPHWRQRTATRERVCLNGVWQIRPIGLAPGDPKQVTAGMIQHPPLPAPMAAGLDWGYGKVPSTFPGSKENAHDWALPPAWSTFSWASTDAAWYRRTIDIPADWQGRRILLDLDTLQSQAAVFIDDKLVGRATYPRGIVDLTDAVTVGNSAVLTMLVIAKPFQESRVNAMNPNELYLESAELKQRGLCGDVFLRAEPKGARFSDVQLNPSVRKGQLLLRLSAQDVTTAMRVKFSASFNGTVEKEWTSDPLAAAADGSVDCVVPWRAAQLWDIDAPNLYDASIALVDESGKVLDEVNERFGFREMWLDGRDIILNGSPIHWRVTKIGNTLGTRSKSQMAGTFRRMRDLGFNCMILDYDFYAGSAPSYTPMYEAADEVGVVLVATIPSLLPWKGDAPSADARKAWEQLTDYCIATAQNHPSVLAYSTNHNRLGYPGSLNPDKIDGLHEPKSADPAFAEKRKLAAESEAYIRRRDPSREVYHHSGGNFGTWETTNCYLNWMPVQERMDYLQHWADKGAKPLFLTEFGMPFVASWGRYRGPGVYRPTTDSEPLFIEYAAAITGPRAYEMNATHAAYVDGYESSYAKSGRSSWGVLTNPWMRRSTEWNFVEIQAMIARKTFPAMRTYGLSAILPWDYKSVANWTEKTPAKVTLTEPAEQWTAPGIHPDFTAGFGYGYDETWFTSPAADTFKTTSLADAYRQVNRDVLAWIAGRPEQFTEQSHLFRPGHKVVKQAIVINDLRRELKASYEIRVRIKDRSIATLRRDVTIAPGRQQRDPIEFTIPDDAQGEGAIELTFTSSDGASLNDSFSFQVLSPLPAARKLDGMVIWDPKGKTTASLAAIGLNVPTTDGAIETNVRSLIVGREALTADGAAPDIRPLLERGGRVIVFEQTEAVLNKRLGFRTAVPSLRNVFVRTAQHPILNGLADDTLRDWNSSATLIRERLSGLPAFEAKYPTVDWLGFRNTRVWKNGNVGQVASVVIEKPQSGDFTTIVDGGFDLQYAPLLVARHGAGEILFCQMDVSGRSAADPAAELLLANMVNWAASSNPPSNRATAHVIGDESTHELLKSIGVNLVPSELPKQPGTAGQVWIVGSNVSREQLESALPAINKTAGTFLFLFQSTDALKAFGDRIAVSPKKVLGDQLPDNAASDLMTGIGPTELHLRALTAINAVSPTDGWQSSSGSIAQMQFGDAKVIFCQIDPRTFDYTQPGRIYVKLTQNRTRTMLARLLANAGVTIDSPVVDLWSKPAAAGELDLTDSKWLATADPQLSPERAMAGDGDTWKDATVPGEWSSDIGTFWYRVTFDAPADLPQSNLELAIGRVDDEDWTYLNGQLIGHIGKETHPATYYRQLRQYSIPSNLLKPTGNVLVIKCNNINGPGGILEGPIKIGAALPRWRTSYYHDVPIANDDPYRYYRW